MAEVGEPLAKMLTSTSSTNETNNEANNEANNGVVISLASHRWNKDTCAWTDMNTNHSSVRSDPPFLHGSPDDIKESFVCFTKPNLHSSELLWHVDHFLELRRMTASHGTKHQGIFEFFRFIASLNAGTSQERIPAIT